MSSFFTLRSFAAASLFFGLLAAGCGGPDSESAAEPVPIIIYLVDTLRTDRLGVYGYTERATSPILDGLAADSVVFDAAYAPAPWTVPSVASILTSTFACEHGLVDGRSRLSGSIETLAERLSKAGYDTGAYYANLWVGPTWGLDRGYAVSESREYHKFPEHLTILDWPKDTADFLDRVGSRPFFLYIHTIEPHDPWSAPPESLERFGHIGIDTRIKIRRTVADFSMATWGDWLAGRAIGTKDESDKALQALDDLRTLVDSIDQLYDSGVFWADRNVGDVIEVLKERGVWDKAVFVFLSDHGEEMFDHDSWYHGQSVYDELMHVPMIIHFPRGQYGGRRVTEPVSLVDVMPTLLDYAGHPELCEGCRGVSLLPLLDPSNAASAVDSEGAGPVFGMRINETTYFSSWAAARGEVNVMVRQGRWKAIWNEDPGTTELYEIVEDAGEQIDVSGQYPEQARKLAGRARAWLADCRGSRAKPGEIQDLDLETRERLRSMGYLE
jgi:arylsulfatase A-like enzyme